MVQPADKYICVFLIMFKQERYLHYSLYFLLILLAFWQIAFYVHPVKYDMVDCFYPWRYFIGECLQEGRMPLWNPYQNLGSPICADPSSGVWYPVVWVIGFFSGYDLFTLGWEYLFHVFFAGIGFYKLCRTLSFESRVAFITGLAYMLCGVFVGNAQHLTYVVSACWMPFVLNYFYRIAREKGDMNSIKAAVFLFLMITGGYPAFTIILFYLLLILALYYALGFWRRAEKKELYYYIGRNMLFVGCAVLLSAVMIAAIWQVAPYITRTNQFPLSKALFCPFTPQSFISFVLPFPTVKAPHFFETDQSMANGYFGILMFLICLLGIFRKKQKEFRILFWFGLFCLTASVGAALPVREFLFHYVPGMNLFRFPSVFRLFAIISFLLCAASWLSAETLAEEERRERRLVLLAWISIAVMLLVVIIARLNDYLQMKDFILNKIFTEAADTTISQHLAFQAIIQVIVLALLIFVLKKAGNRKIKIQMLCLLLAADLILSVQLNAPYSIYGKDSAKEADAHIATFPDGFPLLKDQNVADVNPFEVYKTPFWKNVNIFQKQVSGDGFNSFAMTSYEKFRDACPNLYASTLKNKIVFLSDKVLPESRIPEMEKDSAFDHDMIFINDGEISAAGYKHTAGDTAMLTEFAPDSFVVNTTASHKQLLMLLQNNYTGWQVAVNGTPAKIFTANYSLMAVEVPAGQNVISFTYDNKLIRAAFWISASAFLVCLLLILIDKLRRRT
jgi:hypothetical protein